MTSVFKRSVASSLIGLMGINTLAWLPSAWADNAPRTAALTYTLSFDIPDHGAIDMYHNTYTSSDRISNSLYMLRNTAVEDLLNTRRSLKILIGGTARLRRITQKNDNSFDVPGGIIDLYLLGQLGADSQSSPDENSSGADTSGGTVHGIDVETVPEVTNAIHWLGNYDPVYDENLRAQLLVNLAYQSAQLTKLDQALKFIQTDYWNDPYTGMQFYREEILPLEKAQNLAQVAHGQDPHGMSTTELEMIKAGWLKNHDMQDTINNLAVAKEQLLNRYHLLGITADGKPLYQRIYAAMQASGFPSADMVQSSVEHQLPPKGKPFALPTAFETALDEALDRVAAPARLTPFMAILTHFANAAVDDALVQSLDANTERLTDLSSQINYDGSRSSPLLQLARYDDLWETAIAKYGYLRGLVDMEGARAEIDAYWQRRDTTQRHLRYVAIGVGIGIGIAAVALTGGAAGEAAEGGAAVASLLDIPVRSWLVGTGMLTSVGDAALSSDLYFNSKETAGVAEGLYLGTTHDGSYTDMTNALEMSESDHRLLISSLVALGFSTYQVLKLAAVRTVITRAGQTFVRISSEEVATLRTAVAKLAPRAEALAPMGRALLATVRAILGTALGGEEQVMALEQGIASVARELKMAPAVLASKLEAVPGLGGIIRKARLANLSSHLMIERALLRREAGEAIAIPNTFGREMLNQQINNFVVSVVAEGAARGKRMLHEERNDFIGDMIRGSLITAVLVINGSEIVPEAQAQMGGVAANQATTRLKVAGNFWNNPVGQTIRTGSSNAMIGMVINGVTDGASEVIEYVGDRNNPNAPSGSDRLWKLAKGTAWNGITLGISSTLRFKFFKKVQDYVVNKMGETPGSKILIQSAWTANNWFGGWSYVYVGQKWHFLDSAGNPVPDNAPDNDNLDISKIGIDSMSGAFFKVTADDAAAGYMFDFLRSGDQAGPAPVIQ